MYVPTLNFITFEFVFRACNNNLLKKINIDFDVKSGRRAYFATAAVQRYVNTFERMLILMLFLKNKSSAEITLTLFEVQFPSHQPLNYFMKPSLIILTFGWE